MDDKRVITIEIPEYLYELLQNLSAQSGQPVEQLVVEAIERSLLMYDDTKFERLFDNLSVATIARLWRVLHGTSLWLQKLQLEKWLERAEPLIETERAYVDTLLEQYNRYVMAISEALLYLKQRGHDVDLAALNHSIKGEIKARSSGGGEF